jgi:hypothetical protein
MPKSKSTPQDRTKRAPRDPGPEREEEARRARSTDVSDGVVEEELDELDTDKYEPPAKRH